MTKKVAKKKKAKRNYWANIYSVQGVKDEIVVQGNTFKSKDDAQRNIYPGWALITTKVVYSK